MLVMVGVPEPLIFPVRLKAPMLAVEIVFTVKVPLDPLSVKVNNELCAVALSLIANIPAESPVPKVITVGLMVLEKVSGEALDNVKA